MSKGLDVVAASSLWAKGKVEIPDVIFSSTYVMVTTYDGDLFNPDLIPGDRQAVADVQEAIEKWGRYKLVYTAREADMILVVRTGRVLEARGGSQGTISTGPGGTTRGSAQSLGAQVGDPEDTLGVFLQPANIKTAPPLWRGSWRERAASSRITTDERVPREGRRSCGRAEALIGSDAALVRLLRLIGNPDL